MLVTTITLAAATSLGRPYLKMIAMDFGKQIGSIPLFISAFTLGTLATLITITPYHETESLYQTVDLFKVFWIESLLVSVASIKSRELLLVFAYLVGVTSSLFQTILMRLEFDSEKSSLSRFTIGMEVLRASSGSLLEFCIEVLLASACFYICRNTLLTYKVRVKRIPSRRRRLDAGGVGAEVRN
ncbi:predicted protein [Chaetoceros tenuissimus]|uniref:Uncharacterized protein n=1 Tax=Chaetoceros tenuissimus TaxID=426638 RepID=A0AAD3CMR3_9STRA|nr:predicted protein [Chaetoceros tenuissimus]